MPQRSQQATTTARSGLQATVPLYLDDVTVDDAGFITDYRIAFLPPDAEPGEVKRLLANSLNLDEPHRCRVYDKDDRDLAGHPGTPAPTATPSAKSLWWQITSTAPDRDPRGRLLVAGRVKVEWSELGEGWDGDFDPSDPDDVELLRFDFYALTAGEWVAVSDASYCTRVPVATSPEVRQTLLAVLLAEAAPSIEEALNPIVDEEAAGAPGEREVHPTSRKLFEHLSWIAPSWAD
jgi:hypothetical protein